MADFTRGPSGSNVALQAALGAGQFVNVAAAVVSIALIGGVGVWGYKLLMRDVTGVPVVQAMAGDMRVAPENPGGEIASHVGLSVNSVPALGGAAEPEDRLILAPSTANLQAEDMEVAPTVDAEAGEVVAEAPPIVDDPLGDAIQTALNEAGADAAVTAVEQLSALATPVDPSTPLTAEDVLALADQIAAGTAPLSDLSAGEAAPIEVTVNGVAVNTDVIPDVVPGVRLSLRPTLRPANRVAPAVVPVAAPATSTATETTAEVTTAAIPVGTKLVQLGAFDSVDIAATEWVRITQRFPDFFDGKEQVIQEATSGGRTFFRLRAIGFEDLNDARRFCSAMSAEGAACIPVVVR